MVSPSTDRRLGLAGNTAYKTPATTVSLVNLALSGEQTINGASCHAINAAGFPDRVLCTAQTDATQNGIWDVNTGSWTRSIDSNGNYDLVQGTQVYVTQGNGTGQAWVLNTLNPITIGTTALFFSQSLTSVFLSTLAGFAGSTLIGWMQAGASAILRTVSSKLRETVSVADFGAVDDGATDAAPAFRLALATGKNIFVPRPATAWLLATGTLSIADGQKLYGSGEQSCFVNITANSGSGTTANAMFQLTGSGAVEGLAINYPTQAVTDLVASILVFPPTFSFNGSTKGAIRNIRAYNAYDLLRQDSSNFSNLTLRDIYAIVLHTGLSVVGHMGDVSWGNNIQIIHYAFAFGFNGGPIDLWCRKNSISYNFAPTGGAVRIDLFQFSNCGAVGGSCVLQGTAGTWLSWSGFYADICSQAIKGTFSRLTISNPWISPFDGIYGAPHMPAINVTSSKLVLGGGEFSLVAAGSQSAIVGDTNDITLEGVRFSTSRGYFAPIVSGFGLKLNASGCSVSTSNYSGPMTFTDVSTFDMAAVTIDGIRAFGKYAATDITPTNFNMAAFTANVPNSWTTGLGTPANFLTQLSGGSVPGIQIQPSPVATASFSLVYTLPSSITDNLGFFYVTCQIQILDVAGTGVIGTFEWGLGNATDGYNYSNFSLGNGGTSAECSGLPANVFQYVGFLLAAPLNPSAALNIILNCNYPASATQVGIQIKSLQLWNINAQTSPTLENANGHEFLRPGGGSTRDSISGGVRQYRRNAVISTANASLVGDRIVRTPPVTGQPKAWSCTVAGSPGTWVSEGNL